MVTNTNTVQQIEPRFSGLGRMIRAELYKLRKRPMTGILMIILMVIIAIVNLLLLAVSKTNLPNGGANIHTLLGLSSAIPFALSLIASFGSILAIILVANSVGNEYNWKTIRTAVISSESRFKFLSAKLISLGALILVGMIIGIIFGFIMSLITTALGGYAFDFSFITGSYLWTQFLQFLRTFWIIMPFGLLSFFMSIFGRSAMPGIATGIGWFSGINHHCVYEGGRRLDIQCSELSYERQCQCYYRPE